MEDITGRKYGRLTVVKQLAGRKLLCMCDCGNEKIVNRYDIGKRTNSCGCLKRELVAKKNYIHGGCKRTGRDRLYTVWVNMNARCNKQYNDRYNQYGLRGIKVCDEWKSYGEFKRWAIENGYDENALPFECTIDRIDVNGMYSPENCRFVPMSVQANNKTTTHWVYVGGERMSIKQASDKYDVPYSRVEKRVNGGWDINDALFVGKYERRTNG